MIKEVNQEILKDFVESVENPFRRCFSYEENDEIIGYFVIDIIYDRIELINIFVKKEERNRKIGTNMLKYLIDFARSNKSLNITLEVKEDNIYAIRLYESFGFEKKAIRKGYYNGVDGILMELIL